MVMLTVVHLEGLYNIRIHIEESIMLTILIIIERSGLPTKIIRILTTISLLMVWVDRTILCGHFLTKLSIILWV